VTPEPISVVRGGEPTDEEMAAIAGAAAVLLLAPSGAAPVEATVPRWRFSGRWWTKPIPIGRDRPVARGRHRP
jgi:hypothetical protein